MNEITRQRVLKLLEGLPVERQIQIVKAAKVLVRRRADQAREGAESCLPQR